MKNLLKAEVRKLATIRVTWFVLAGALGFTVLQSVVTVSSGAHEGSAPGTAANLVHVLSASGIPAALMLVLGVFISAGEYQHRTVTQTFLVTPKRSKVITAKLVVAALLGLPVAALISAVALAASFPGMLAKDVFIDLFNGDVLRIVVGNLLTGMIFGVVGVSVGALVRNQQIASLTVIGWGLIGEGIISVVVGTWVTRWLPGGAAQALTTNGAGLLPVWGAALILLAYAMVIAVVATRTTLRRDIA